MEARDADPDAMLRAGMTMDGEHEAPMRPGMGQLLKLLRGQAVELRGEEAELVLALAEAEHILPWAAWICTQQGCAQGELGERLRRIERDAAIAAFYWCSELKSVLRAFEQAGIAVAPLKGPFLAERLYGSAALRMCRDLDLLVKQEDLERAEVVLQALGFIGEERDDYHREWLRGSTAVELHHDVENPLAYDFQIASALERAKAAEFQGQRCLQLDARDELLFLCLHGVRHRFERMNLVLDLCLGFEKLSLAVEEVGRPEVAERSSLLTLGLAMARRLRPETAAGMSVAESAAEQRRLDELADRLWQRLMMRPGEPPDWRELHQFYLEVEVPRRRLQRRLRHLRILLDRLIPADYEFAARLGCRRVWQVRLLRPVRLLRDALR